MSTLNKIVQKQFHTAAHRDRSLLIYGRSAVAVAGIIFSVSAYAAAPSAVDDSRTIPVNSSITLNPIANDFDPDGDAIAVIRVTTSNNASVTLNSDGSVFYVPNKDFQGVDTFTYTIQETQTEESLTSTATVTVNVSNSNFVAASNGDNNRSVAEAMDVVCTKLRESSDSELGAGRRNLLERCNALDAMSENNPDALNDAFRQIAPEETIALMRVTSESTRAQTSAVSQRIGQLQAGNNGFTLNGIAALNQPSGGGAGDAESIWSAVGFFASIQHDAAKHDVTDMEAGYKSGGNTLTLGADYRFNEKWVMGGAVGFSQNDLDYSRQSGSLDTEVTSFIVFNSYNMERSSFETQLGYASTSFDSIRKVSYSEGDTMVSDTMRGSTGGTQLLFNSQYQWEWNKNALSIFPFLRFDYLQNKVDGYGENGSGGLPMIIGKQSTEQITVGAGVQSTYVFNKNWGVLIPSFKVTFLSEVSSGFDPITSRFAYDPDPDNVFTLKNDGEDKSYAQVGIGSSFIFKAGMSGFLQYQQMVGYNNLSAYQIQGGIRYEF
ncbi:MAG: autotransporter domain-containing protein [Gammaproteobacteria bacterium]|nr:MAG: autotransporter domain-containing protein [Gammaproteobacteria bacterium]